MLRTSISIVRSSSDFFAAADELAKSWCAISFGTLLPPIPACVREWERVHVFECACMCVCICVQIHFFSCTHEPAESYCTLSFGAFSQYLCMCEGETERVCACVCVWVCVCVCIWIYCKQAMSFGASFPKYLHVCERETESMCTCGCVYGWVYWHIWTPMRQVFWCLIFPNTCVCVFMCL